MRKPIKRIEIKRLRDLELDDRIYLNSVGNPPKDIVDYLDNPDQYMEHIILSKVPNRLKPERNDIDFKTKYSKTAKHTQHLSLIHI